MLKKIRLISKSGFLASNLLNIGAMEDIHNSNENCETGEELNNKLIEIKNYFSNSNVNRIQRNNSFVDNNFSNSKVNRIQRNNSFIDKKLNIQEKIENSFKSIDDEIINKINEINNKKKEINKKIDIINKITVIEIKEKIDKISDINTLNINSKKEDFDKIEEEIKEKEEKLNNKLVEIKTGFINLNNEIFKKSKIIQYVITDIEINDKFDFDKIEYIQEKLNKNIKFIKEYIKNSNLEYKSELEEFEEDIKLYNKLYNNFGYKELVTTNKFIELKYEDNFDDFKYNKENNDEILKKRKRIKEKFIKNYNMEIKDLNHFFSLKNSKLEKFDEDIYGRIYVENRIKYIIGKKNEKEEIIREIKTNNEDGNFENYLKTTLENFQDIKEINYEDVEFKRIHKVQNNIISPVKEEDRIYIQSDIEGKYEVLLSVLKLANIVNIDEKIDVFYNFITGKFEDKNPGDNLSIKLNIFKVNKDFKGTYINIGDIVDRCAGNNNCLKTLLLILYIKQELGDKIKLICGNHEIGWYCNDDNPECNCCKNIKDLITLICYKAISLGQIKFFDNIEIGGKKYVLSHKIIYHNNDGTREFKIIFKYIDKNRYKDLDNFDKYIDKDHCLTEEGFKILDEFNSKFKENFTNFISKINAYTYDTNLLRYFIFNYEDNLDYFEIVDYDHRYDEDKLQNTVKNIIKNSINGHDHHDYKKCYNKDINILIADNRSHIDDDLDNYRSNIHFIDKSEDIINDKIIKITKKKTKIYDLENDKYIKY